MTATRPRDARSSTIDAPTRREPVDDVLQLALDCGLEIAPHPSVSINWRAVSELGSVLSTAAATTGQRPYAWDDPAYWPIEADKSVRSQLIAVGNALNFRFWRRSQDGTIEALGGQLNGERFTGSMYLWRRIRLVEEHDQSHELRAGQLDVDRASSVYLESGRFSAEKMARFLEDTANAAAENEFPHMRVAGEMSWVLPGPPGADEFFAYESSLNEMDTQIPSALMCMYDLELFGTSMLVDVLKTHPKVLVGSIVLDNPEYLTPDQYLATRRRAIAAQSSLGPAGDSARAQYPLAAIREAGEWDSWNALTEAEGRVARLVASGLTNKGIAEQLSLSHHTVDAHLKHTFTKLGIHSRVELTVVALRRARGRRAR